MFRAHVLIVRRSKLYYTASGIITLKQVSVFSKITKITKITKIHVFIFIELYFSYFTNFRKKNYSFHCDDTRGCIVQF